jgi:hypothetical protein
MKFIKQKSTGQIVHREMPHTDKTLDNAVHAQRIDKADLEIVEENWTDEEWNNALQNQLGYAEKRKAEYPTIAELVVALYDTQDRAEIDKRRADVKKKYPKE